MKRVVSLALFLILSCLSISCSKKNQIERIFISSKSEYWRYSDKCGTHGIYFKFHKNGTYDKYNRFIDDGFTLFNDDGDIKSGPRNWSISNDSTFIWDKFEYKIKQCQPNSIVLTYKNGKCEITLLKVIDKKE